MKWKIYATAKVSKLLISYYLNYNKTLEQVIKFTMYNVFTIYILDKQRRELCTFRILK